MAGARAPDVLRRLRETTEKIQHFHIDSDSPPLALGVPEADSKLGGGLAYGALHEIAPDAPIHLGAACGFTLALAALAAKGGRETLWIQTEFARLVAAGELDPMVGEVRPLEEAGTALAAVEGGHVTGKIVLVP